MRDLPKSARRILWLNYALGASLAILAVVFNTLSSVRLDVEMGLYIVLAVLAGSRKVSLMRYKAVADVGSMSLAYVLTFAATLRFGPQVSVFIGAFSALSACLYPKRQPLYQLLFNVFVNVISTSASGFVFLLLNGGLAIRGAEAVGAVTAACFVFFLVNTGFVTLILAAVLQQKPMKVWNEKFLWTAPSYFMGAFIGTLAGVLQQKYLLILLTCGVPIAYFTYRSYRVYSDQGGADGARQGRAGRSVSRHHQESGARHRRQGRLHAPAHSAGAATTPWRWRRIWG